MLTASLACFGVAAVFVGGGFALGRVYERQQPRARVVHLAWHASHHHRPARHVRVVPDRRDGAVVALFDFEQSEPA